jgi:hypothetical protein
MIEGEIEWEDGTRVFVSWLTSKRAREDKLAQDCKVNTIRGPCKRNSTSFKPSVTVHGHLHLYLMFEAWCIEYCE